MISSVLAVAMAVSMQPTDTTRTAREAFTRCLRTYVDGAMQARTSATDFQAAYPQQCTEQQAALRDAVIRRERATRASQADAEESANGEIEDARANFAEWFTPPAAAPVATAATAPAPTTAPAATAAPAAASAAAPSPTPAAQPAAATTTPQ